MRMIIAARLQVKHGSFRDLPLTRELAASLEEWFALRNREGCVATAWGSRLRTISITFPASTALPLETRHSTPVSSSRASATLLPSERGANLRDVQALLPLPRSPRRPTTSQSLCHYHSPQCRLLFVGFRDLQGNRVEREPIIRRRRGNTRPPRWHYPQDRRRQAG